MDPRPFLPTGFAWAPRAVSYEPPRRPRVSIGLNLERTNEDLAIVRFTPQVSKDDFVPMARALHQFLVDEGVRVPKIQPCPIGEAFVRFSSAMERQRFLLGSPRQLGQYHLSFVRRDEGDFCAHPMDREVWLMLMCYPPDGRSLSLIRKSICFFAQLLHGHPYVTMSRVIVKALVQREQDVPDDFVFSIGECQNTRTFTILMFIITAYDQVI